MFRYLVNEQIFEYSVYNQFRESNISKTAQRPGHGVLHGLAVAGGLSRCL